MADKQLIFYIFFIAIGIFINILIEGSVLNLGYFYYSVSPTLFGIWWFTYVLWVPWLLVTYELGNWLSKRFKLTKYLFYFLIGAFFAFSIDQYATTVGLYSYTWNSVLSIGKVPIEDFFAVGLMITLSVTISSFLSEKIIKKSGKTKL